MKYKFYLVIIFLFLSQTQAKSQWVKTNCPYIGEYRSFLVDGVKLYAGTWGGGLFLSSDNGGSWTQIGKGLSDSSVFAVAADGTNLFAGTQYQGVFLSTNNGQNWAAANTGLPSGINVTAFLVTGSKIFAGTSEGVFVSTNHGASWTDVPSAIPYTNGFASIGTNLFIGADGPENVLLSSDGGTNWEEDTTGLRADRDVLAIASTGTRLLTGFDGLGGIYLSGEGGKNWAPLNMGLNKNAEAVSNFAVSGSNFFASTYYEGIFLSTNTGQTWSDVSSNLPKDEPVYVLTLSGSYLFAGTETAVWKRPLSEMTGPNSVERPEVRDPQIGSFPNPFSRSTAFSFTSTYSGDARVSVFNLLGIEVFRLFSGELEAGSHIFTWNADGMPPGIYACVARMNSEVKETRVILIH